MVKFRKPVIVAAMICFSAMMATGCLNPGNTSGTKQYISQNQKKTIETDNLILSILVDTFISKISLTMQPGPKIDSISGA